MAESEKLSHEARDERLKSGERRLDNRTRWAAWVLMRAGLLERVGRARYQITEQGLEILKSSPDKIDISFLKQNTRYQEEIDSWKKGEPEIVELEEMDSTPKEIIESAYNQLNDALASDLLDTIKTRSPSFFEELVIELLLKMGYGGSRKDAGIAIGRPGDGGIDGVIKEDPLGLDLIYVQAKRWEGTVPTPDVKKFIGVLSVKKSRKGILIATSKFSNQAYRDVENLERRVILIDGPQLANLMIEHNIGVSEDVTFKVKKLDESYFEEII
ncbi:MAG: restriction endonuclease [Candidatus Thorarchaeota archaeon]